VKRIVRRIVKIVVERVVKMMGIVRMVKIMK